MPAAPDANYPYGYNLITNPYNPGGPPIKQDIRDAPGQNMGGQGGNPYAFYSGSQTERGMITGTVPDRPVGSLQGYQTAGSLSGTAPLQIASFDVINRGQANLSQVVNQPGVSERNLTQVVQNQPVSVNLPTLSVIANQPRQQQFSTTGSLGLNTKSTRTDLPVQTIQTYQERTKPISEIRAADKFFFGPRNDESQGPLDIEKNILTYGKYEKYFSKEGTPLDIGIAFTAGRISNLERLGASFFENPVEFAKSIPTSIASLPSQGIEALSKGPYETAAFATDVYLQGKLLSKAPIKEATVGFFESPFKIAKAVEKSGFDVSTSRTLFAEPETIILGKETTAGVALPNTLYLKQVGIKPATSGVIYNLRINIPRFDLFSFLKTEQPKQSSSYRNQNIYGFDIPPNTGIKEYGILNEGEKTEGQLISSNPILQLTGTKFVESGPDLRPKKTTPFSGSNEPKDVYSQSGTMAGGGQTMAQLQKQKIKTEETKQIEKVIEKQELKTEEKTIEKLSEKQGLLDKIIFKNMQKQKQAISDSTLVSLKKTPMDEVGTITLQKEKQRTEEEQKQKEDQPFLYNYSRAQKQTQPQSLLPVQKQLQPEQLISEKPATLEKQLYQPQTVSYQTKVDEAKKKSALEKAYSLLVRRKGKFYGVETGRPLSREEAFVYGVKQVAGTLASTFKIAPTGGYVEVTTKPSINVPAGFLYKPKTIKPQSSGEEVFTQARRFRLGSFGERKEIQQARKASKRMRFF